MIYLNVIVRRENRYPKMEAQRTGVSRGRNTERGNGAHDSEDRRSISEYQAHIVTPDRWNGIAAVFHRIRKRYPI